MDQDDADWADWNAATFAPLAETDARLAEQLLTRLVEGFMTAANLSAVHREEALHQASIASGQTPRGVRILRATLPLGAGEPAWEWDGSATDAEAIIDSMADVAGMNVVAERKTVGPTGWEPEFDEDRGATDLPGCARGP